MVARKGNCKPEESQHALSGHSHDIYKSLLRENGKPTRGLADQNRGRSARWPLGKTRGRSSEDRRPEGRQSTAELEELRRALVSREKSVPCRYLYDAVGSQLYDEITEVRVQCHTFPTCAMPGHLSTLHHRTGVRCRDCTDGSLPCGHLSNETGGFTLTGCRQGVTYAVRGIAHW